MKRPTPLNPEQAWNYSLRLLSQRSYSEYRLREKLTLRQVDTQTQDAIVNKLKSLNMLDDTAYAASLVRTESLYRHRSQQAIRQKLHYQGVAKDTIQSELKTHYAGDEEEQARYLAQKYWARHAQEPVVSVQQKLAGYLARRGFPSQLVYKLVREMSHTQEESAGSNS